MKNNRTFLEKLLDGAEVEWKTLDEISSIYGGLTGKGKADFENGNALYVPYKNIFNNIEVDFNNLETVNVSDDEKQYTIKYGDVLFTGSSETAEEAGMSSAVTTKTEQKIYLNSFSFGLRFNDDVELLPEFSKFLFRTLSIRKEIVKSASGVTRFNISKARFKKIKIPIPPLSVQTEIVKILDALTALTSELTSELILRRKQYEYYREKLLSEEELGKVGFEWKPLGEVTNIKTGQAVSKYAISQNPGIYPVINSGREPLGFINKWNTENDPIGITTRGAGVGSITWQEGKYFRGNLNYSVTIKSDCKLNVRFLYHILLHFQKEIHNLCSFTGIPALNTSELKKLEISIPAIEEQQRIVSILDKFEALTNSISEGLPLAIEQNQKRYEYYRELLLNFS
jgi:putative type I restriction-modification system specificity protein